MENILLLKYSVGLGIVLLGVLAYSGSVFFVNKKEYLRSSILVQVIQGFILCCIVSVFGFYAKTALVDFNLTFVSKKTLDFCVTGLISLIFIKKAFRIINLFEYNQIDRGHEATSAKSISRIFKIIVFICVVLLFGEHFGMSFSSVLAFGGIGGIAIAMASKDILSNLFSGVMLYYDRPFNIGDWVSSPDRQIEGTVVEIGWRLTKIMTFDHRPLFIPNSAFATISVENPGQMIHRRIKTEIGLRYEDADKVALIVKDIKAMILAHDKIDTTQTILVYFNEFSDSSLNIMVYCFTKTTVWAEWLEYQQDVYLKMIEIVHHHGADFAYPSQSIYIEKQPKQSA